MRTLCSRWRSLRSGAQHPHTLSTETPCPLHSRSQPGGRGYRLLGLLLALGFSSLANAFDLQQLSDQLAKPEVIHGSFVQEKHLRALPQPLTSKGSFVLAKNHGLLWLLKTPLQQDYRITGQGIARREGSGWQMLPNKSAGAEQNRLFLAVLQGDSSGLQRDFELALAGDAKAWKLTLTPRSLLLKQVFNQINIDGGELVQRIELLETQGDSTVLKMHDSISNQPLSDAEQHDFAE
ncbi:Outer membrane lipoprotein-sorting protein [Pseudomonas sp. LAMO17WK12:I10]|uniref:outer membrane lipoprotein carrier protein LolA n=1 Tax=Pseudomonas sp. LAMO17WK12:I9 TaxID=1286370 RepID=UPI000BC50CE8|nr:MULTISPECIES: outer membrane lipoprotein carrier protein LolA [unclassified Pseudomonas]PXX76406.1 outer membrane lipoprotein-sorting protein [Pseudomonas sp. LAMO17WK12:I9]SNY05026.1 Outer membrane lipoprotein-sorting protein [Pseudomonas sp. LAMO17WK12:I10]